MTDAKLLAIRTNMGLSGYLLTTFLVATTLAYAADTPYEKPPKELAEILNAPPPPTLSVSPSRDYAIVLDSVRHPSIEELSQPMLRLAGVRIDVNSNGRTYFRTSSSIPC